MLVTYVVGFVVAQVSRNQAHLVGVGEGVDLRSVVLRHDSVMAMNMLKPGRVEKGE